MILPQHTGLLRVPLPMEGEPWRVLVEGATQRVLPAPTHWTVQRVPLPIEGDHRECPCPRCVWGAGDSRGSCPKTQDYPECFCLWRGEPQRMNASAHGGGDTERAPTPTHWTTQSAPARGRGDCKNCSHPGHRTAQSVPDHQDCSQPGHTRLHRMTMGGVWGVA